MSEASRPASEQLRLYAEAEDGSTVILHTRKHRLYPERFWTMFEETTKALAQMDRPVCYHRTLLYLISVLDPIQFRRISAKEVCRGAKISFPSAQRALSMLEADGVILTNGERTGALARRLSNRICWASTSERFNQVPRDPEVQDARGR